MALVYGRGSLQIAKSRKQIYKEEGFISSFYTFYNNSVDEVIHIYLKNSFLALFISIVVCFI